VHAEELAALGTREFIGVGFAGSISPDLRPGEVVLCDGAIRDEGTSHHYAHPSIQARPSVGLQRQVGDMLTAAGIPFHVGRSWTTDAPYRETRAELRHYRKLGVLTVEMEAASLFIFARHRGVHAASVFVISDLLSDEHWEPHYHRAGPSLERVASAILAASLGRSRLPVRAS
jgi:uridine phosphorylase